MRTMRNSIVAFVAILTLAPALAGADPVGVVKESAKTAGHTAKDGALTVGRTARDAVTHGPHTAKRTFKRNAARTKDDAQVGGDRIDSEAHDER